TILATLDNEYLAWVRLQNLQSVGGSIECFSNLELVEFNIQSLSNVGGDMRISANPKLCENTTALGQDYNNISVSGEEFVLNNKTTGCD
ncbi:MAG: hypothetical protein HOI23_20095, partial [Deltaproteobacteria bacterium]|nr:hypothetical protein [Deltaproteobacteria bacterium]